MSSLILLLFWLPAKVVGALEVGADHERVVVVVDEVVLVGSADQHGQAVGVVAGGNQAQRGGPAQDSQGLQHGHRHLSGKVNTAMLGSPAFCSIDDYQLGNHKLS